LLNDSFIEVVVSSLEKKRREREREKGTKSTSAVGAERFRKPRRKKRTEDLFLLSQLVPLREASLIKTCSS